MLFQNQSFVNNSANQGGAIFYLDIRPNLIQNIFLNNSASYGKNIGSYPTRVKLIEIISSILNGSDFFDARPSYDDPIFKKITLGFYDFDDQLVDISDQTK